MGEGRSRNQPTDIEFVLNGPNRILESSVRRQDRLNLEDEDKDRLNLEDEDKDGLNGVQKRQDGWNILHNDKDGLDELQDRKDDSLQRVRDDFEDENPPRNNGLEDFERSKDEVRRSNSAQDLIDYTSPIKESNKSSESMNLLEHNISYKNKNGLKYEIENDSHYECKTKDENGRYSEMYERRLSREELKVGSRIKEESEEYLDLSKSGIFQNSLHRFKTEKIEELNIDLKYSKGKNKNSK